MTDAVLQPEIWANNARTLLVAAGLCAGNVTRNRDTPSRDDELPTADLFIGSDEARSESRRGNQGHLQFDHKTTLGIEIRRGENDGPEARAKLAIDAALVLNTLLPRFWDWAPQAEGCTGYRLAYLTATEGALVESRVAIQIEITSHSDWPAPSEDLPDLQSIGVSAGNGLGSTIVIPQD